MIKSICKRGLSALLVLALVLSMVPQMILTASADEAPATFTVDGAGYTDFNAAMEAAQKSGSKGVVTVATSGALPAGNLTVPKGVVLLIPCVDKDPGYISRENGTIMFNHDGTGSNGSSGLGPNAHMYAELTIPATTVLNVEGTVLVNSVSGRSSGTDCDIVGGYGQINLSGKINVLGGGTVDCFGFIKGSGRIEVMNGGTVGDLYIVRNWRGGSQALKMYEADVYPMNESDCHNVEVAVRVNYGGSLVGLVKMYGDGRFNYTRFPQVDVKNGLFRPSVGGYVVRTYENGIENYAMYGGADFSGSTLTAMGVTLSTSSFVYPIDGDIHFELHDGSYNFTEDYKLLPGVEMKVASDAELTINPKVSVAVYEEFNDVANGGTEYPQREPAVIKVEKDGRFTNSGIFAGTIETESTEIFIGENPIWELDTREANGPAGSGSSNYVVIEHTVTIKNPNADWSFGSSGSIVWEGKADYSNVQKAIAAIPKDLDTYYEAQSVSNLRDIIDRLNFDLPADRQAEADALVDSIRQATKKLVPKTITLYLDPQGGTINPDRITVDCIGTFGTLPNPTRENYRFAGWYDSFGERVRNTTAIRTTENMTLYAQWNLNDADYDALEDAQEAIPTDVSMYTDESVAALREAEANINWRLTADKQAQVDRMEQAIWDAIAGLQLKKVTINLDANGGVLPVSSVEATYSRTIGVLPVPTREGYSFLGWKDASGAFVSASAVIKSLSAMDLVAQWKENPAPAADYSAIEQALSSVPADLSVYTDKSIASLNAAIEAIDYTLTAGEQVAVDDMAAYLNKTIAALEYKKATLLFNANGGKVRPTSSEVTFGQPAGALPVPTLKGYVFTGWFAADGSEYTADTVIGAFGTISLKASWKEQEKAEYTELKAILDKVPTDLTIYTDATSSAVTNAVNAVDWEITVDEQAKVDAMVTAIEKALSALELRKITVTFNANGGTVNPTSIQVVYGQAIGSLPTPVGGEGNFGGWAALSGKIYNTSTIVKTVNDLTLTAIWGEGAELPPAPVFADYTAVDAAIAGIPADLSAYTDASIAAVNAAVNAVVRELTVDRQAEVDAMAKAISDAVAALELKPVIGPADYTGVDEAIAAIPTDLSRYTEESIAKLNAAVNAVVRNLTDDRQAEVDAMATAIINATAALEDKIFTVVFDAGEGFCSTTAVQVPYGLAIGELPIAEREGYEFLGWVSENGQVDADTVVTADMTLTAQWLQKADYSAVDAALAKVPADLSVYTEDSAAAVSAAVSAVVRDLNAEDQSKVNAMAKAISDAVAALELKPTFTPADYSAVDAAIAAIPADLSIYTNESVAAVNAAVNAIIRNLPSQYQTDVDDMASAINYAVAALELKPQAADYSAVDAAIAAIPTDLSVYTGETVAVVNAAVSAIVRDLTEDRQAEVDAMAKAIYAAIAALELKPLPADYSAVDMAISVIPEDLSVYTEESVAAVQAAVNAVVRGLTEDHQGEVNAMAKAIREALDQLELKSTFSSADYSAVDAAIAAIPADLSIYTEESVAAVQAAVNSVVRKLPSDYQFAVDFMAQAINDAVAALEVKPEPVAPYEINLHKAEDGTILKVEVIVREDAEVTELTITEALAAAAAENNAPVIQVTLSGKPLTLNIPTQTISHGNVVCKVGGEVLKETVVTADGVQILLKESCSLVVLNKALSFTDVEGYWSTDELEKGLDYLTSRSIIAGKTATTFVPGDNIQRRTVALVLWRMAGSPVVPLDTQMTDKDTLGKTYLMAVCWAEDTGIITGYADGTFRGEKELERRHFALMLFRFVNYMGVKLDGETVKSLEQFPDHTNIGSASWDACQWAVDNGIINGRGNGSFDPNGTTTRGQMAVILFRFLQKYYPASLQLN